MWTLGRPYWVSNFRNGPGLTAHERTCIKVNQRRCNWPTISGFQWQLGPGGGSSEIGIRCDMHFALVQSHHAGGTVSNPDLCRAHNVIANLRPNRRGSSQSMDGGISPAVMKDGGRCGVELHAWSLFHVAEKWHLHRQQLLWGNAILPARPRAQSQIKLYCLSKITS
jgi:hypothetical protein